MAEKFVIETINEPNQIVEQLEDRIYEHNSSAIGKDDGVLFSKIIKDKNDLMVAGIAGWTWADACEITHLWVDRSVRKNGLGKILLHEAESEAKRKGCVTVIVKSYSFQAPEFYEKQGYKTEYIVNDFPSGHNYHFLTKRIL